MVCYLVFWLVVQKLCSACPSQNISTFLLRRWEESDKWRKSYPRNPPSHKCHRSPPMESPLPSRTTFLLQPCKVSPGLSARTFSAPLLRLLYENYLLDFKKLTMYFKYHVLNLRLYKEIPGTVSAKTLAGKQDLYDLLKTNKMLALNVIILG